MDNRTFRVAAGRARRRRMRALMEAVEGRVLLCAFHPGLDPAGHPAFAGPVTEEETLAPALPDGVQTRADGMPILNSRPSAPADIFLDLDGEGTRTPYDTDANPATFGVAEQEAIYECWRQISEYFAVFDINVTTIFASARPKAWLVAANSHTGVGFSSVNVFPNSAPQSFNPSGDVRGRQSGLAHELGHNFGLSHQSTYNLLGEKTDEYATAPDTLHGPIMGVDYSGKVHKWTIGHASGSPGTLQDDLQVIANRMQP